MVILESVQDTGGMNAVRPVGDVLKRMGHMVFRVASGVSVTYLQQQGLEYIPDVETAEGAIGRSGYPDVFVTSMCSGGGIGRDLVPLLRVPFLHGRIKVIAVQDQWGARLLTDWKNPQFRPDHVMVNDEVAVKIVRRAWPDFPEERIHPLGYAALDALHGFDTVAARARTRKLLGIDEHIPLVYFSGQLHATAPALEALLTALREVSFKGKVLASKHPRMDPSNEELKDEARQWSDLVAAHADLILESPKEPLPESGRIAAADVVIGKYPTAFNVASALRIPAISILFPGSEMERSYIEETGGLMQIHPLVELGCVAGPRSVSEFASVLDQTLRGELESKLRSHQEKHVVVDGKNAERIAQFISAL